ncbi:MAG: DUF333 domain-containing protein [Candidatus Omnitrophica bacterium]|nr:DUF333 domain-containing protein [Candidatus Omnitrophota bacterium]
MTKINNKVWTLTVLITLLLIATPNVISECQSCDELSSETVPGMIVGMKNPAAVYCTELGYEYKIIKTEDGERGICVIPDTGEEFDAWDFLEGKVGQKYSYCATIGCDTITATDGKNSFSSEYAVCVPKKQSDSEHFVTSSSESMSVTDLMNLGEKVYPKTSKNFQAEAFHTSDNEMITSTTQVTSSEFSVGAPSSFDWRDVDGENWVTTVKAQGGCGSCWAFATVAAVEAKINIVMNDSAFDVDLSEQYLVSDCCENCGSCFGGSLSPSLSYIRDYGITDESCFPYNAQYVYKPYTGYDSPCSDRCSLWDKRLYTIDSFGWNEQGVNSTKDTLEHYGPLAIYIAMSGSFDQDGIYRDSTKGIDHAVLLVGYNDADHYWIAKNSWGSTWNDDGYFKIGYGECYVNHYDNTQLAVIVSEDTYYNYPLPLPTPRPTSVPLPTPLQIPYPIPLPFQLP